jgi:hypothetical protein
MSIEIIEDKLLWDNFINSNAESQLFHKWDSLKIIEKHSKHDLKPYGIYKDKSKKLLCVLPLFIKNYNGLKFIFSEPPRCGIAVLGPVMDPTYYSLKQHQRESMLNEIVQNINKELDKLSPNYISITLGSNLKDTRHFKWTGYQIDINYTYNINLLNTLDEIWNKFDRDCRREIRTNNKYNLMIKRADDLQLFYSIIEKRYNEQGLQHPFISFDYFKDLMHKFPNNIAAYFLYNDRDLIDVLANYEFNNRLVFWRGYVCLDKSIHSNEFLTWEFIKKAKTDGLTNLEIQGANTKRLCLFKSKFNPTLETYYILHKKDLFGKTAEYLYKNYFAYK